jgi:hypothetical protein
MALVFSPPRNFAYRHISIFYVRELKYMFMGWSIKAWVSCRIMNNSKITEKTHMDVHTQYIHDILLIYIYIYIYTYTGGSDWLRAGRPGGAGVRVPIV